MKFNNKRSFILGIIFFVLISVTIGYAYLTSRLNFNGTSEIGANTWNVAFDNIIYRGCNTKTENPAVFTDSDKQTINFNVTFNRVDDSYDFLVDLVNNGTIDAMIDTITLEGVDAEDENLDYQISYLDGTPVRKCDSLYNQKSRTIRISFKLKNIADYAIVEDINYNISLKINYIQLDDKSCEIPAYEEIIVFDKEAYKLNKDCDISGYGSYHTLYIDPNGGTYEGSEDVVSVKLLENQTYILATPILEGNRNHWTTDHDDNYFPRDRMIKMGNEDIHVTANWFDYSNYVARINDNYYETIQEAFDEARRGDTVVLLKDTVESPTNNYVGGQIYFDMAGYTVTGTLTNSRGAYLTLINEYLNPDDETETKVSKFQNLQGVGAINYGILTLGVDDENVLTDEGNIVALIGSNENGGVGLKNTGTFNFYDGYLEGYIGLSGIFNKAPKNYYVFVDHNIERDCQKVYLVPNDGRAIAKSTFTSGGIILYYDLQDGLKSSMDYHDLMLSENEDDKDMKDLIGNGATIEVIRNDFEASYPLSVLEGKKATVDIAGHTVPAGNAITNNGTFEIINSVPTKGSLQISDPIVNNGTLVLDSMKVSQTTDANVIENNGALDITSSSIRAIGGYAIKVNSGTRLDMDNQTSLNANKHALYNGSSQNFSVKGGTIEGIYNAGHLTIEEGTTINKLSSNDMTYGIFNANSSSELILDHVDMSITSSDVYTYAVYNDNSNAKVTVKGGNLTVTSRHSGGSLTTSEGATVIYSGIVKVQDNSTLKAINNNGSAKIIYGSNSIVIEDGTWEVTGLNTAAFSNSSVTMNGGTISSLGTGERYIVYNYNSSGKTVTVNTGATLNTTGTCFYMYAGTVNVNGGELTCGGDFVRGSTTSYNYSNFGTVNINGSTITAGGYGTYGNGTVNMGGGTLNTTNTGLYFTGDRASSFTMTSGRIVSSNGDGIHSDNANNKFTFGTDEFEALTQPYIEAKNTAINMAQGGVNFKSGIALGHDGYGVYVNGSSTFGVDDRKISIKEPTIQGYYYGLYIEESQPIEVYDGIFKGISHGYTGVINGVADGYQLKEDGEETINEVLYNTCYLIEQDSFLQLKSTGTKYNSLQDAIDAVAESDTIIVLKDHPVRSESSIPSSKTIILDFKDFDLTFTKSLTNNGTLTLTNTTDSKTGGIVSLITKPVINRGTLTIENGEYSGTTELFLDNFGTTTMNGGTISIDSRTSNSFAVYNENDSSFTLNDGIIDVKSSGSYGYGVFNNSSSYHPVYMTVNGGKINVESTYTGRLDLASTYGANAIYGGNVTIEDGEIISKNVNGTARGVVECNLTTNGGTINVTGKNAIGLYNSNLTMNHGLIDANGTADAYGTYDYSSRTQTVNNDSVINSNKTCMAPNSDGVITINNGTITCENSFIHSVGYYGQYKTININGGTMTSGKYGIYGRGAINMTGGTMKSSDVGIYLYSEGADVKIYGGDIISDSSYGIYADDPKDKVSVGVSDANHTSTTPNVTGYTTGLYALKGVVNVDIANIIGETQYGVYSGGTSNFGIDETPSDVSTELPMVCGKINGVYINKGSTVNIYDGIYKGQEAATNGFISGFPDAYSFVIDSETIDGEVYEIKYLTGQDYFLKVGNPETGEEFNSLQQAIDYAGEENTIYVVADHVIKTEAEIAENQNITIDFYGHTLLSSKSLINNGTLTLVDETGNGGISTSDLNPLSKLVINNKKLVVNGGNYMGLTDIVIHNAAEMVMNGGYISNTSSSESTYGVYLYNTTSTYPTFTMNGGTIEINSSGAYGYGIYAREYQQSNYPYTTYYPSIDIEGGIINVNSTYATNNSWAYRYENGANGIRGGNVVINGGEIHSTNETQYAKLFINCASVTITDGEFNVEAPTAIGVVQSSLNMSGGHMSATGTDTGYDLYNYNSGMTVNISGTTVLDATHTCYSMAGSTTTINNGTFNCGTYGFAGGFGTLNFNDGILNANGNYGFSGNGTLNIRDGEINAQDTAIYLTNTSTLDITGGNIVSNVGYGVYSGHSGNNIHVGTVSEYPTTHLPYISGPTNGIQLAAGTLILGTKDNNVELSSFIIQGGEYGVNNISDGTIKFYDGILKGTEDGRYGSILEIEEGTNIIDPADTELIEENEEEITYQLRYLIKTIDIVENERTGTTYKSLQTAIDEAENGDILDLIANVQLFYPVTIPAEKEVTLDYKGHEIVTTKTIVNRGIFSIIDTADEKGHHDTSLKISLYDNYGTLSIDDITLNNLLTGEVRPLVNEVGATLNLDKVTINSVNNVYNKGSMYTNECTFNSTNTAITDEGIINMTKGVINSTSRGIYSSTNGNGEINEVTIIGSSNPIYKYSGSGILTIKGSHMLEGQIYNRSGTLKFENGDIHNKIINSATLIADGTEIADECHIHEQYYSSYTSIENSGTMELDNVTYSLLTTNNGSITMLNNSGTFKSNSSTYDVNKTNDYKWCPTYYWQPACGGFYAHLMYNTGNIITSNSTYDFKLTDEKQNHETHMYLIEHRSGKLVTDGDTFNMEGGLLSYGIYSLTSNTANSLKDTTFNISKKAKTQYGIYQENGTYTAEGTKFISRDATSAWGIYVKTGTFKMTSGGGVDVLAKTAYGAYIDTATALVELGIKDANGAESDSVKTDYPEIKAIGTVTGIGVRKVNGHFNFYDGKLIGNTHAKPDITTDTEQYYEATSYYDEENDYTYCILEYIKGTLYNKERKIATINGVFYDSLDTAFRKAKAGEIVKLARSDIEEDGVNNNPNDVTFDLNGYTLGGTITNNGYLTITNGQINGGETYSLVNTNVLRLGTNDENIVYDEVMLVSENTSVQNSGIIYMYDGYIKGLTALEGRNVTEPYYAEIVNENVEETVGDQTITYETIYLKDYVGETVEEIVNEFDYTGNEQIYVAPSDGYYLLETWGASGGYSVCDGETGCGEPGKGGYARGIVYLSAGETIYINVGGEGGNASLTACSTGGYNGGGIGVNDNGNCTSPHDDESSGGGGGATHIASRSGLLASLENYKNEVLIVAGGGGGASWKDRAGSGGGYIGGVNEHETGEVATQTSGASFGRGKNGAGQSQGSSSCSLNDNSIGCDGYAGGGGGWYGGGHGTVNCKSQGNGGSGYIGNALLGSTNDYDKVMYGYKVTESTEENTKTISTTNYSEDAERNTAKLGNGYAKVTQIVTYKSIEQGNTTNYDFVNHEETFVAPESGYYLLETWGAQGGSYDEEYHGGYGAYSKGVVYLEKDETLYINVGGQGTSSGTENEDGGYNGGGSSTGAYCYDNYRHSGSGGGATHIAKSSGLLSTLEEKKNDILIVSGGGGGSFYYAGKAYGGGASGGGMNGNSSSWTNDNVQHKLYVPATGGTQTSGGIAGYSYVVYEASGSFGRGGDHSYGACSEGAGGGGGFYGGGNGSYSPGAGGSGYIGNNLLLSVYGYEKSMYGFDVTESNETNTKTISTDDYSSNPETNKAKSGNGYAKITKLIVKHEEERDEIYNYKYTGDESTFVVPKTGYYLLEAWGAQGGATDGYEAGYGAYSKGVTYLTKGTKIFINVGGQGFRYDGGYNGGGAGGHNAFQWGYGGGGATHIALSSGLLTTFKNDQSDLLIVAGGGGGNGGSDPDAIGGSGGGYYGSDGIDVDLITTNTAFNGTGATDIVGGYDYYHGRSYAKGTFGQGSDFYNDGYGGAGGGGGFYGGGGSSRGYAGAGGGSGYIGNELLINYKNNEKAMYAYKTKNPTDGENKTYVTYDYSSTPISEKAKAGDGFARITFLDSEVLEVGTTFEFDYNGTDEVDPSEQTFIVPTSGYYKLETWGASGGQSITNHGWSYTDLWDNYGYGGYASGVVYLSKNEILHIYVGEQGKTGLLGSGNNTGISYNGGGAGASSSDNDDGGGGGGGATDIRLLGGSWDDFNSLKSRIIVAGGGSGSAVVDYNFNGRSGGSGGGVAATGDVWNYQSVSVSNHSYNATQTSGYSLGIGENGITKGKAGGAGAGGGYLGGFSSNESVTGGAGGGSGFVSGCDQCIAIAKNSTINDLIFTDQSVHYSGKVFDQIVLKDGNESIPSHDGATTTIGNDGNGYAKITFVKESNIIKVSNDYNYTGDIQTFTAPASGIYLFETWGAQGGGSAGGKGGYSKGYYALNANQTVYVYVGGQGNQIVGRNQEVPGGWNGGGGAYVDGSGYLNTYESGSGGGATDISLVRSDVVYSNYRYIRNDESYKGRLIVAGGGGGSWKYSATAAPGGVGGGFTGGAGYLGTTMQSALSGGSQTGGGTYSFSTDLSSGHFGYGGNDGTVSAQHCGAAAGGGGYYGGAGGNTCNADPGYTGGGGSGYVEKLLSFNGDSPVTLSGTEEMPTHDGTDTMIGNAGDGFARITMVDVKLDSDNSFVNSLAYRVAQNTDVANSNEITSYTTAMTSSYDSKLYLLDSTKNDDFPIYFWRGTRSTTLNNFIFADYCWLGLRSTDTGGIKIIYNGVPVDGECTATTGANTMIGSGKYSSPSTGYDRYATETTDSIIKSAFDTWFVSNINDYSNYLEDTVFCYDTGDYYSTRKNSVPSLYCSKDNSFTVSDEIGNGYLDYPIAPISADEAMFSGMSGTSSQYNFLYNGQSYWVMTMAVREWIIYRQLSSGYLFGDDNGISWGGADMSYGYRPVLSLNANVKLTGNGSQSDPYVVVIS